MCVCVCVCACERLGQVSIISSGMAGNQAQVILSYMLGGLCFGLGDVQTPLQFVLLTLCMDN